MITTKTHINDETDIDIDAKRQKIDDSNLDNNIANSTNGNSELNSNEDKSIPEKSGIKKRKYALCFGYSGQGYFGLQRNVTVRNFRTIEDEIVDALVEVKAIPQGHADEMFKMSFNRAARTDKGVSAAANLISLKMELDNNTIDNLNSKLPPKIRIFGYRKVTQSFDAKKNCDGRTYMYLLPTYAFCPIEEQTTENYRMSESVRNELNDIFKMYIGTHNYHNFTSGKKFIDASAKRYIINMECGEPFLKGDHEFAVITVKGQSFMLHQIRKMIGLAIAVVRGIASRESILKCWTAHKVDMPMAPALGLMLDKLHYDKYNRKFGNDGIHEPLTFLECGEKIEKFKHEYIYPTIVEKEIKDKNMLNWLSRLCFHNYDIMYSNYPPGAYTGVGRAAHKLELLNGKSVENEDENDENLKNDADD